MGCRGSLLRRETKRRIAVAVDGSSGSKAALRWAIEHYYTTGDVLLLIHCRPMQVQAERGGGISSSETTEWRGVGGAGGGRAKLELCGGGLG